MNESKLNTWLLIGLICLVLWSKFGGAIEWPAIVKPPVKVTAVTFVYEKDSHVVPTPVLAAFDKLNRAGIVATIFEQDVKDGDGQTPDQYKVPLAAALADGMPTTPVLVVTAGDKVVRVVLDPKAESQVLEAAK